MFELVNNLDQNIIQYIYDNLRSPVMDSIMSVLTHMGDGFVIWIILCIVLISSKMYRKVGIIAASVLALNTVIGELILKNAIGRIRPYEAMNLDIIIKELNSFSMPSGHALSSFSIAFVLLLLVKNWKIYMPVLLLAIGILLSRVYLTVHYPSDVLFSVVIALIVSCVVIKIARYKGFLDQKRYGKLIRNRSGKDSSPYT